uniref:Uncharacterized protein n=1 Tax=Anguilla anguilla TaxID=7936 RepID=A0A0E9S694_ANGAN
MPNFVPFFTRGQRGTQQDA